MATTETLSELIVRSMQMEDIEAVSVIENSVYYAPWPKLAFSSSIGLYPAFVIENNTQILGYCIFSMTKEEAHILNLVIAPAFQAQGLGRILLQFVLDFLEQHQITRISLEVAQNNLAAIRLYESHGFKPKGQRKKYYQTPEGLIDALILVYESDYTSAQSSVKG